MKATIEIKEITLNPGKEWNVSNYPETGFYLTQGMLFIVNVQQGLCTSLCNYNELKYLFSVESETNEPDFNDLEVIEESVVSESFALKMLAVAMNKEKYKEVE